MYQIYSSENRELEPIVTESVFGDKFDVKLVCGSCVFALEGSCLIGISR